MTHRLTLFAAAFGMAVLAAPTAYAFTIDNQGNNNGDGAARYTDPDQQFSGAADGKTVIRQGNTTFQFGGGQSFQQRYSTDNMFNQVARPGEDR